MDEIRQAAKAIWPQVSEKTKLIISEKDTVVVPVCNGFPAKWYDDDESWDPEYEFVGWFDWLTWRGKFWRAIGKIFKSEKLYRRGQFPHYVEVNPVFGQVTIELQRYDDLGFAMGYNAKYDVLVARQLQTIQERLAYHWQRIKQFGGDWAPIGEEMALWINGKREWRKA